MILPSARDCADLVADPANTMGDYFALCLDQIANAVVSGAYSCTLTTSGKAGADVQRIRTVLKELGFILTQTTTTITISWGAS